MSTSASLTMLKPLTVWITKSCGKFWKRWESQTTLPASWEICTQVKKQQLELDMEQQTGSKLGKAVYCHPAYLIYMQSTSCKMLVWMKYNMVSSAYLRWLIFLPEILILSCTSSSPSFLMMYFAYKLNKQGDNIQPWRTPFPIWNQSVVPCPVLTVASWPAYRFFKRQVRWSGIPITFRIFHSLL